MLTALAILTLLAFILLFSGEKLTVQQPDAQARAIIKAYDAEPADPSRQEEREARLYHELAAVLTPQKQQKNTRLPFIAIPLFFAAAAAAAGLWYQQNGQDALKWHRLQTALAGDIRQSQVYGTAALNAPQLQQNILKHTEQAAFFSDSARLHNVPLLYCQALQRALDRQNAQQLQALAACYSDSGEYAYAAPVYDRLIRLEPNDSRTILAWAQAKTLANPDAPIADDVHQALEKLHAQEPNNPMAQLFLASSYQQHGDTEKAAALWRRLQSRLPKSDPLYPAVSQALAKAQAGTAQTFDNTGAPAAAGTQFTAHIRINPELLKNLPATAKLYLIAAPKGQPMPLAVKILPLQAEQTAVISDAYSMQGGQLPAANGLELRLKLSPSGTAADPNAQQTAASIDAQGNADLTL